MWLFQLLFLVALFVLVPSEGLIHSHRFMSRVSVKILHGDVRSTTTLLSAVTNPTTAATSTTGETTPEYSFVRDDLRTYAMKLHTRDQSPKEGQQKAETPFTKWEPSRNNYLQFLVDSLEVYETLEELVQQIPALASFKSTGLERSKALKEDLQWMVQYDKTLTVPPCGENGKAYAAFLRKTVQESVPKFLCHYYNHYFAHTAGGRMIGKGIADKLLEGNVLKFYQWNGDVKELLDGTRAKIDAIANTWSSEEKQVC